MIATLGLVWTHKKKHSWNFKMLVHGQQPKRTKLVMRRMLNFLLKSTKFIHIIKLSKKAHFRQTRHVLNLTAYVQYNYGKYISHQYLQVLSPLEQTKEQNQGRIAIKMMFVCMSCLRLMLSNGYDEDVGVRKRAKLPILLSHSILGIGKQCWCLSV